MTYKQPLPNVSNLKLPVSGIVQIEIDYRTGRVTRVIMAKSTGSAVYDDFAVKAFYRAKFKPRTATPQRIPFKIG